MRCTIKKGNFIEDVNIKIIGEVKNGIVEVKSVFISPLNFGIGEPVNFIGLITKMKGNIVDLEFIGEKA